MPDTIDRNGSSSVEELQLAMEEFLQLARHVNRLQPAAGACPRDLEVKLRDLQQTILAGFRELAAGRPAAPPFTANSLRRVRRELFGCEIALRGQLTTVAEVTTFLGGVEAEAGIYRPDSARRASPGAWMNMRSAP